MSSVYDIDLAICGFLANQHYAPTGTALADHLKEDPDLLHAQSYLSAKRTELLVRYADARSAPPDIVAMTDGCEYIYMPVCFNSPLNVIDGATVVRCMNRLLADDIMPFKYRYDGDNDTIYLQPSPHACTYAAHKFDEDDYSTFIDLSTNTLPDFIDHDDRTHGDFINENGVTYARVPDICVGLESYLESQKHAALSAGVYVTRQNHCNEVGVANPYAIKSRPERMRVLELADNNLLTITPIYKASTNSSIAHAFYEEEEEKEEEQNSYVEKAIKRCEGIELPEPELDDWGVYG